MATVEEDQNVAKGEVTMFGLNPSGQVPIDLAVLEVLPEGTRALDARNCGKSDWSFTAKINAVDRHGQPTAFFLKYVPGESGRRQLRGEFMGMEALHRAAPGLVPKPIGWGKLKTVSPPSHFLLVEFKNFVSGTMPDPVRLGARVAEMHSSPAARSPTGMFGFPIQTFDGARTQTVDWDPNWTSFFSKLLAKAYDHDTETNGIWPELDAAYRRVQTHLIPRLIGALESEGRKVEPVLIHGDLWDGNVGTEAGTGDPWIYDCAAYYGHNEMELGIWRAERHRLKAEVYRQEYLRNCEPSEPKDEWDDRNRLYSAKTNFMHSACFAGSPARKLSTPSSLASAGVHKPGPNLKSADPLGLSLLYSPAPENHHVADIIFIHGLGGSSMLTWCKDRRLDLFWPQKWLPYDEVLQSARIFTFGYNAHYRSVSQSSALGISDFSKNLLYDMLFGRDPQGRKLNLGEMILDLESATLGYPGEVSRSLNADHHNMCKFENPEDPNFRVVLGALRSLVSSESAPEYQPSIEDILKLRLLLSTSNSVDHDLVLFSGRRTEGTCQWVLDNPSVSSWLASPSYSEIICLHGRPGRGKSVIASFLIQHLQQEGALVQYFFVRARDESKRSVAALLRSLAFQVAQQVPTFRKSLLKRLDAGFKPTDAEWRSIWKKLFAGLLLGMESRPPLYWVIDGLDEAHSPNDILELLGDISGSTIPIRVAVTSRWSPTRSLAFDRMESKVSTSVVSVDQDTTDLTTYVGQELLHRNWGEEITQQVAGQILDRAEGNFLWIHLILEELKDCNTEDDIRERLTELPSGMDGLYQRMEETIARIRRPADKNLARQLLMWGVHVHRPLAVEELADALEPEFGRLLDILQTTTRLCGHFIAIEGDRISLIHHTAREYLTATTTTLPFSLEAASCHAEIFKLSIASFLEKGLRSKLQRTSPKLFEYRATSWPHHLAAANLPEGGEEQLDLLARFFTQTSVLTWIYTLASLGQLTVLINASKVLHTFVRRIKQMAESATDPALGRYGDLENLEGWSRDLLKILGKFGECLSQAPEVIYTGVAPFCPTTSSIYKIFGTQQSESLRVLGASEDWDDCLARVSVGREALATVVCCSGQYLAVGTSDGSIFIWDCTTFHQICTLNHGETVACICFSAKGDRLATYGFRATKIWSPRTGQLVQSIPNQVEMQALCLQFVDDDAVLLVGTDRRCVLRAPLTEEHPSWEVVGKDLLRDVTALEGTYLNSPSALAFSPDGSKIAAAYRSFPSTVWLISPATPLRRITRSPKLGQPSKQAPFVSRVSWHPGGDEIIGIFLDGYSFKLNIVDGSYSEQQPAQGEMPSNIVCSPDGLVYAICGVGGVVRLFDYETSTLIYKLNSEDSIRALCFAPDGRRFFDTRSNYCSVWEPNALVRLAAPDNNPPRAQATGDSTSSMQKPQVASEKSVDESPAIVLVQPVPPGAAPMVCLGNEEGAVELLNYKRLERILVGQTATRMSVEHVAWSGDGERLCYAELRGRITVFQIEKGPDGRVVSARQVERFQAKVGDSRDISQVLFLPDSSSLLLSSPSAFQIWFLDPARADDSRGDLLEAPLPSSGKWINHPYFPDFLLFITPRGVALHRRVDLTSIASWSWWDSVDGGPPVGLDPSEQSDLERTLSRPLLDISVVQDEVEDVRETFFKGHIMVRMAPRTPSRKLPRRFFIFDTAAINPGSIPPAVEGVKGEKSLVITPIEVPPGVSQAVEMPLDVLPNGKFVFIDRSLWVCSWLLKSVRGLADVQRHFFLPRDWVPPQNLGLLRVTASGEILCPHRGTVCVILSPVGTTW
ncbi:uncharacterized protein DNG_07447 [Cephalotrichum gorgonifer]|uniref:protein-ribulosamine 3-kinase n=1 Tax=Cephalotrichum gorgonifer TaxID=2041049 RepID=A0AAE8N2E8_9PEZI|nr:uncharacterized protein DNG_07447 [Cephalotrichum gorgonifer]